MELFTCKTTNSLKNLKKKTLKVEYTIIRNAVEVSFIKSSNLNTTIVLLTFNLQVQAYNVYIPRQQSDTAVYKYHNLPMVCHNCYKNEDT